MRIMSLAIAIVGLGAVGLLWPSRSGAPPKVSHASKKSSVGEASKNSPQFGTKVIRTTPEERAAQAAASLVVVNLVQDARSAFYRRDFSRARQLIQAAAVENDRPPMNGAKVFRLQVGLLLGEVELEEGHPGLAAQRLQEAQSLGGSPLLKPTLAIAYARNGNLAGARAIAKSSLLSSYEVAGPRGAQAEIVDQDLPTMVTLKGVEATAHLSKGLELWHTHDREAALTEFLSAAELSPTSAFARAMAGIALWNLAERPMEAKLQLRGARSLARPALKAVVEDYLYGLGE